MSDLENGLTEDPYDKNEYKQVICVLLGTSRNGYVPNAFAHRTETRLKRRRRASLASTFVFGCTTVTYKLLYAAESREAAVLVLVQTVRSDEDIVALAAWIFVVPC
ncbi:hypothetical protein TNCV_3260891 [Trichonephila clavipes]|nr:hypothetical protein TNCV_3260891 [Trichonephila clavipes]